MAKNVVLWQSNSLSVVSDAVSDPEKITAHAIQLRDRERAQITFNLDQENYELVTSFVWLRAMSLLKKQLSSLGSAFVGELLQRPDIDEFSDISTAVSDIEAISLARDLGILSAAQTMRLLQSQATITHFSGMSDDGDDVADEMMTREEAIQCLRVCVQAVLGQQALGASSDFGLFRDKLSSESLKPDSPEVEKLGSSPYFFMKTAIGILLALLRSEKGAQLEHASRNALAIIPTYWDDLKKPERWQIGQAYAEEFSEGHQAAVKALHAILTAVKGFDYVPENLRSSTFVRVANAVISAHQGMNNFYNEPGPMKELASLGSSIPSPALATCITAILCVKLGNPHGVSNLAQSPADQLIKTISADRWIYYFDGRLDQDRTILTKFNSDLPLKRWMALIKSLKIDEDRIEPGRARRLIAATNTGEQKRVREIANRMLEDAVGK